MRDRRVDVPLHLIQKVARVSVSLQCVTLDLSFGSNDPVFVWGREQRDDGEVAPIGLVVNLRRSIVFGGTLANVTLSTDSDEGPVSFGIPQVTSGGAAMPIRGLIVAMITADEDDAGTDDLVHLRITTSPQSTDESSWRAAKSGGAKGGGQCQRR